MSTYTLPLVVQYAIGDFVRDLVEYLRILIERLNDRQLDITFVAIVDEHIYPWSHKEFVQIGNHAVLVANA